MSASSRKRPLLLVDGYNLIRSGGAYAVDEVDDFDDDPINRVREHLIADVAAFAQERYEAVIVFDGGGNEFSEGAPVKTAGISVIFSAADTDADSVIERLTFKAQREGREVLVVSSDWDVQNATFRNGVTRMSAVGFVHEMDDINEDLAESAENHGKFTLGGRLDPDTRAKLEQMLRD